MFNLLPATTVHNEAGVIFSVTPGNTWKAIGIIYALPYTNPFVTDTEIDQVGRLVAGYVGGSVGEPKVRSGRFGDRLGRSALRLMDRLVDHIDQQFIEWSNCKGSWEDVQVVNAIL